MSQRATNEVHSLIAEAIEAVATPTLRDVVIARALELAGVERVPDEGRDVRVFIRDHLAPALAESFELDMVEGIVDSLNPLMERTTGAEMTGLNEMPDFSAPLPMPQVIESSVRAPESPKLRLALASPQPEGTLRCVILFSSDATKFQSITDAIGDATPVVHAANSLAMLDAIRDHGADGAIVVVDCADPSIEPRALLALGGQIATEARILFWAPAPELELELMYLDGRRWRTASADVTPERIARICCALVRGPRPDAR